MGSRYIAEGVKRRLWAESMGRCMNPSCQCELFRGNGDIVEQAHIDPYCKTADNSFENLVILCPSCHTDFDKNHAFTPQEVLNWKKIRQDELASFFRKKYATFEELKEQVFPLLLENRILFESYYLNENRELWDRAEPQILANNRKLKGLLSANTHLFQTHQSKDYSNLECVYTFLAHVDEFEASRPENEKCREILFPPEIDSIFGVAPVHRNILPSTEALEQLITHLCEEEKFKQIVMGIPNPYFEYLENGRPTQVFLDDVPRLRQMYSDYHCFRPAGVRLDSLNYALRCVRYRGARFEFLEPGNLREILVNKRHVIFVYEYCISQAYIRQIAPEAKSIVVNLHNWNGQNCISAKAYQEAKKMDVELMTTDVFYDFVDTRRQ